MLLSFNRRRGAHAFNRGTTLAMGGVFTSVIALTAGQVHAHADAGPAFQAKASLPIAQPFTKPARHVYINYSTGERVISEDGPLLASDRGASWAWSNRVIDPCAPELYDDEALTSIVFPRIHNPSLGDAEDDGAINYWHDWFESPGDTIIDAIIFDVFSQIPDPGMNGVEGFDFLFAFTENDDRSNQSGAIAHSPILIEGLLGAEDTNGNGTIEFQEGEIWVYFVDFASGDTPTDVEVGDTNGVSDGAFGQDSIFSGVPGIDTDGNGLINSGFVVGFRQPGVAEGDGLIDRYPELTGFGLENPDGYDPSTFPNIRPVGTRLAAPSSAIESYITNPGVVTEWPSNPAYNPLPSEGIGAVDGFTLIDAVGNESEPTFFGGFACDENAVLPPFQATPWSGFSISLNLRYGPIDPFWICANTSCNYVGCYAEPLDVIDLSDITAFIFEFLDQSRRADFASPFGVVDLADINAFVVAFQAGCP